MKKLLIGTAIACMLSSAAMAQITPGLFKNGQGQAQQGDATQLLGAGSSVPISTNTAATVQLVPLAAGKSIYVKAMDFMAAGTTNVTLEYGTGALCATGLTTLTGAYPLAAQAVIRVGNGASSVLTVPAGNALCLVNSAAVQVSGFVSYDQQ